MLCLTFTQKKFVAGVVTRKTELLRVNDGTHFNYGSKESTELLRSEFPALIQSYFEAFRRNKLSIPTAIPVTVGIVKEMIKEEGLDEWESNLKEVFKDQTDLDVELIYLSSIEEAFIAALQDITIDQTRPFIVINSLDDYVTLSFNRLNGQLEKNGYKEIVTFKEFSFEHGYQQVLDELISEFGKAGLILNEEDKEELLNQIQDFDENRSFQISKKLEKVSLQANVSISLREFNELLTKNRTQLQPYLDIKKVENLGINNILLLGSLADNIVMKSYLRDDLSLGEKVITVEEKVNENPFFLVLRGLHEKGIEVIRLMEERERRRREEEEKRRKAELEKQAAKDALMNEIRIACTNPSEKEVYMEKYVQRGESLGLPKEVIAWNIQEALKIAALTPDRKPVETRLFESQAVQVGAPPQRGVIHTPSVDPMFEQEKQSLHQLYQIKGVLPDSEFQTKKGYSLMDKEMKVIRIVSTDDAQKQEVYARFKKLYEKELQYYGELSDIMTAKDGKYYTRNYLERITLKEYVRKIGLYNKRSFEELSSSDLKFIFQVLKEVNDLQVSHANINEDNLIIVPKRKWGWNRDIEFRLVGFTSEDRTHKQMEQMVHEIWERIIGSSVYNEFRQKFNI